MTPLKVLDLRIAERCKQTETEHPWWPCAKGCDHCCRSLPSLPTVTKAEWDRLEAVLSDEQRTAILATTGPAPITCPLLDRTTGACTVYEARPIACRTYGFYAERDASMCCSLVTAAIDAHTDANVTWGNGEAVASDLRAHGGFRSLAEWLRG